MKALKRFYGKEGRWYDIGDEVKEDGLYLKTLIKRRFVLDDSPKPKRGRKPKEDKNGKPETEIK